MRVVLDTNVLISGIFFKGLPARVLAAWRDEKVSFVVTPRILDEYRRVSVELSAAFKGIEVDPVLDLIAVHAEIIDDPAEVDAICRDPSDDVFIRCAAAAGAVIVSGDKDLHAVDGALGVRVLTPRQLLSRLRIL